MVRNGKKDTGIPVVKNVQTQPKKYEKSPEFVDTLSQTH